MRQVCRAYGQGAAEVHALAGIDLSVGAGSMVAVMGPSGSGKSTLLTIASSLEDPTSGEVVVCGEDLARLSRNGKARLRRRSVGFVFQDFNLLPGLTAAENVALPLELDGVPARRARTAGLAALESLGLAGRALPLRDSLARSCPQTITSPLVGSSRLPAMVSRVDLPDPLGPITATIDPASTERLMSTSACGALAVGPGHLPYFEDAHRGPPFCVVNS